MAYFLNLKWFTFKSRRVIQRCISSLIFMVELVVVVDSRCWALVARATVAMALRPHQGNCCYPPARFPPLPLL